jgi:CRP-like cAMP-binding protein
MMRAANDVADVLGGFTLFADLPRPRLEAATHAFDEQMYTQGQRILRSGFAGSGFHVILEGEAAVMIEDEERARLSKGDFFGEISMLLDEPPAADVVALGPLRCLTIAGPDLERFLLEHPTVMLRLLQAEARRLRGAIRWQS